MRKILASVLAMAMVASVGVTAFAAEPVTANYTFGGNLVNGDGNPAATGNSTDAYRTGSDLFVVLGDYDKYDYLFDKDMAKVSIDKEEGGKYIGKPEIVSKTFSAISGRQVAIKLPIIEDWTDKEYKVKVDVEVTAKQDLVANVAGDKFPQYTAGDTQAPAVKTGHDTFVGNFTGVTAEIPKAITALRTWESKYDADANSDETAALAAFKAKAKYYDADGEMVGGNYTMEEVTPGMTAAQIVALDAKAKFFSANSPTDNTKLIDVAAERATLTSANARVVANADALTALKTGNGTVLTAVANEAAALALYNNIQNYLSYTDGAKKLLKGEKAVIKGSFWLQNYKDTTDDATIEAGKKGMVVKPVANEENTVEWEDNNNTIARLSFEADSSTAIYFPKLSTKWDNIVYAEKFNDQDAFVREFVSNPSISSTSRAVLELMVPYVNEDDELTVDEADIIVYQQIADGELVDVTSKGTIGYNDADELVFTMKTRELGTYIFAEMPVDEAAAEEAPAEEGTNTGNKVNPGTGC